MSSFDFIKENINALKVGFTVKDMIEDELRKILITDDNSEYFGIYRVGSVSIEDIDFDNSTLYIKCSYSCMNEYNEDYYDIPINLITNGSALKEAIQKDKEEKERKRIAEEEAKRQKEIEKEKKKMDKEYKEYLRLKEKFKGVY